MLAGNVEFVPSLAVATAWAGMAPSTALPLPPWPRGASLTSECTGGALAAAGGTAAGCSRYFRDVLAGEMPTANGKDQCDTWLAAETEQMCLNNPVLPWDADLEENAASKTLGHALALLVGGVAALLVA